ncbi:metal-dependent transcriptional regulator [candidate division KSB1 bacterium]|nr:metal-dependent transcriptional regulator [candidate division KSB1 bacterium]
MREFVKVNEAIEDYLKTIYNIQDEHGKVSTTMLAKQMNIAPSSATGMIKKLARLNLVTYEPYRGIQLTSHGRKVALEVLRHHRLIELYLVEALGMRWDEVHHEAEKLEHVISKSLIERIDSYLGHPAVDPHGAPIPDRHGKVESTPGVKLADLKSGQCGVVSEVNDRDSEMLRYLAELGIFPNARIKVLNIAPFQGPMSISIEGEERLIWIELAKSIFVKLLPENTEGCRDNQQKNKNVSDNL